MRPVAMLAVFALVLVATADDKDKPAVRTLDLKGVKLVLPERLTEPKPVEIKSAEELAKAKEFADAAGRDAVKKQIDFAKEKLVVFAWAGSGGDKLSPDLATEGTAAKATFGYRAGETDDFVRHSRVFAVPKDAAVEVKKWEIK
jgi:hypothetical protein